MPEALIITEADPYRDRWHGLPGTSRCIEQLLQERGVTSHVVTDLPTAIDAMQTAHLVVVNLAGRGDEDDPLLERLDQALDTLEESKGRLFATHSSAISFKGSRSWGRLLGGSWRPGVSSHPQIGYCLIQTYRLDIGTVARADSFVVYDERYSFLDVDRSAKVLASHIEDGVEHPIAWVNQSPSGARAFYDGLGHGPESYDSAGHRSLLHRGLDWVLAP